MFRGMIYSQSSKLCGVSHETNPPNPPKTRERAIAPSSMEMLARTLLPSTVYSSGLAAEKVRCHLSATAAGMICLIHLRPLHLQLRISTYPHWSSPHPRYSWLPERLVDHAGIAINLVNTTPPHGRTPVARTPPRTLPASPARPTSPSSSPTFSTSRTRRASRRPSTVQAISSVRPAAHHPCPVPSRTTRTSTRATSKHSTIATPITTPVPPTPPNSNACVCPTTQLVRSDLPRLRAHSTPPLHPLPISHPFHSTTTRPPFNCSTHAPLASLTLLCYLLNR